MHLGILPLENRIIKALKDRGTESGLASESLESVKKDFTKMLQKTKEFRDLSSMAINDIFQCSELVELPEGERLQLSDRMDFFYVLKGEC